MTLYTLEDTYKSHGILQTYRRQFIRPENRRDEVLLAEEFRQLVRKIRRDILNKYPHMKQGHPFNLNNAIAEELVEQGMEAVDTYSPTIDLSQDRHIVKTVEYS